MTALIARARRLVASFLSDSRGVILPYVTLLLIVFVGLATLALDGGRFMSQQTQMQSAADALALAGARELDQRAGARARATAAINSLISNGLTGLGHSAALGHAAPVFYKALPAASAGFTGTAATSDYDAKFVAVTVNSVTIPTVMPVRYFKPSGVNSFATGAQSIAGFTARSVCDMPPVFICNPYETAGMTDAAATQALRTAMDDPAVRRKMIRMDMSQTSPGHFGYLVPPDKCNGASCLQDWIAKTHPKTCYGTTSVDLNTGLKTSVTDAFNARFDIYSGSLKYSADYAPAVNVRKGYLPGSSGNDRWCPPKAGSAKPVYYTLPIITTTGDTQSGNATARQTLKNVPSASLAKIYASGGQMISDSAGKIPAGTLTSSVATPDLKINNPTSNPAQTNVTLTVKWATSGLPLDSNMTSTSVVFGNGDWNCLDYWTINHSVTAPTGCSASNPSVSRYDIYRYEIANNLVGDWSGNRQANIKNGDPGNGESGAPYCAGGPSYGVDPTTDPKQTDRRIIYVAVINCLAQSGLITGGATADNVPVADFGKFFMTQPVGISDLKIDPSSLYGEMAGLVGSLDQVVILNQVQLYR